MTDLSPAGWIDQQFLRGVQYASDRNLAARQSIYAYAETPVDLPAAVLDRLELTGAEVVVNVGCGNGRYLAELDRRGHRGCVIGLDASPGMLAVARTAAPSAALVVADAISLPLRNAAADVAFAMHMLYHVPKPVAAIGELRRVTRPGARVVLGLNDDDHLRELRTIVNAVLDERGHDPRHRMHERITLSRGAELAAGYFRSVTRHDFASELLVPGREPLADYVRSMSLTLTQAEQDRFVEDVVARLEFGPDGCFRLRSRSGCLICR